jgi:hypothetical protein
MPTISEMDEIAHAPVSDFTDLLDLPDHAFTSSHDLLAGTVAVEPGSAEYALSQAPTALDNH